MKVSTASSTMACVVRVARLSSPFESERAAAGLLATAFLAKHGLSWEGLTALLQPPAAPTAPDEASPMQDRRRGGGAAWRGYCRRRMARLGQALSRST